MSDSVQPVQFIPGKNTPMSPHLQVWKFTVTMAASITHRATGVANAVGMLLLTAWIGSAAISDEAFNAVNGLLGSAFGRLVIFGFTLSVMFHLCNGIRYLLTDAGKGIAKEEATKTAWAAYIAAPVLTVIIFVAAYAAAGA
ncbi:MAG: succinate dehydrogenase, cytochrome b556 subunit [Parvularculaceae bacterium]|nr:succinate dehydrogenase, cytochrome b556 subunit [Parvularculaceae bacterium]